MTELMTCARCGTLSAGGPGNSIQHRPIAHLHRCRYLTPEGSNASTDPLVSMGAWTQHHSKVLSILQHGSPTQTGRGSGAAKWKRQYYRGLLTPWNGKARASSQMNSVTGSRVGSRIHSGLV